METINGSEAWDDLLGFNNGVGGQMNCQDGKCVYLKCRAVEKMFMLENIQEIQSFFLFSTFFFLLLLLQARNSWVYDCSGKRPEV